MLLKLAAAAIIAAACALVCWPPRPARNDLRITFLDVGQGDAIVIQTPRGHALMIDTGGTLERNTAADGASLAEAVGERIVVPFLIRQGIHHVDTILLTHPHGDHVGGCAPILRALGADVLVDAGQVYGGRAYHDCLDEAHRRHVRILTAHVGSVLRTDDGVRLHILAPKRPFFHDTGDDINENSIVVMLEYAAFRGLFMGDAGEHTEARLLADRVDLHAVLLKIGHHGSRFASTDAFVDAVHPHDAVISVGRHNHFGHPAPRVLATLTAAGARIWRTDRCGAVTFSASAQVLDIDAVYCHP